MIKQSLHILIELKCSYACGHSSQLLAKTHFLTIHKFSIFSPFFHPKPTYAAKIVDYQGKEGENRCFTPDGRPGKCDDLSNCPGLLLDLTHLRESLCFKSLFVPGVCCPLSEHSSAATTQRPLKLTTRPTTTRPSLFLSPITTSSTTSQRPLVPVFTISSTVTQTPSTALSGVSGRPPISQEIIGNFVDPEECGQQEYSSGRIVGGTESRSGDWPWLAAIFLHGPKRTGK